MIKVILLDAANTLIFKPELLERIRVSLQKNGHTIPAELLRSRHKLVSEIINFPDRTDQFFYEHFNSELLLSLGILPSEKILNDIFENCTYLPWEKFDDCKSLETISLPKCVLSNFNSGLDQLLNRLLPGYFESFIVSEGAGSRKPDIEFYKLAIERLAVAPNEILYIGDSLKLDVFPAQKVGMNAYLIDRFNEFTNFKQRIISFDQISETINQLNKESF